MQRKTAKQDTLDLTTDDIETEDLVITDIISEELLETIERIERLVADAEQSAATITPSRSR